MNGNFAKVVVLDLDGVILDSADIKMDAFIAMFAGDDAAIAYLRSNPGRSRYEKFRHIYEEIRGLPYTPSIEEELNADFTSRVDLAVGTAPWIPGSLEFLEMTHERIPLYVASATPDEDLEKIVTSRGLHRLLRGWYGSPTSKATALDEIVRLNGVNAKELIFVGDSVSDLRAAEEAMVPFMAFAKSGIFDGGCNPTPHITDLRALWEFLVPL